MGANFHYHYHIWRSKINPIYQFVRAVIKIKTNLQPVSGSSNRGSETKHQMIASQWLWSCEQNRMEIIWSMCMRDTALLPPSIIQLQLSHPIGNIIADRCQPVSLLWQKLQKCSVTSLSFIIVNWRDDVFKYKTFYTLNHDVASNI